jgi:hypothetical protein
LTRLDNTEISQGLVGHPFGCALLDLLFQRFVRLPFADVVAAVEEHRLHLGSTR